MQLSLYFLMVLIIVCIVLYYLLLSQTGLINPKDPQTISTQISEDENNYVDILPRFMTAQENKNISMTLPPANDPPPSEEIHEPDQQDESNWELIEEEENLLLKEAEHIVDRIQETLNNIASNPPNPDEITSKIKAILAQYKFLIQTEYQESINTYISLAVERDCGLSLSIDKIQSLWSS